MDPLYHSANYTLAKLQKECQDVQTSTPAKIVHLQAAEEEIPVGDPKRFNQGKYVKLGFIDTVPTLKFIEVDNPNKIPTIVSGELGKGFLLIFDEILFIENKEKRVLGFGKT